MKLSFYICNDAILLDLNSLFICPRILNRKTMINIIKKASPLNAHECHSSVSEFYDTLN